ncbi:hypothetical protein BH20CHL7_BH20CHL7_13630 [soil metagenome]
MTKRMSRLRALLTTLAWLGAATVIALGAAGLVTAMDAPQGGVDRAASTTRGDVRVMAALDTVQAEVAALDGTVEALSTQARGALAALVGQDLDTVEGAIAAGDGLLLEIGVRVLAIRSSFAAVPLVGTPEGRYLVSDGVRRRYERLAEATRAVDGLDAAWARLTTGSLAASRLSALLDAHDQSVLAAAELGRDADYAAAVETLAAADAAIADARRLRDVLSATVDVSVLDEWLDRNAAYDVALRGLYVALADVGGRVTSAVREAIAAERAAKDRLPPDSRGLILIMADIGRGGMNGAVITIEQARGSLAAALEPVESPGAVPAP